MSNYSNLLGREYEPGRNDCYGLVRDYYKQVWDLDLSNYARPDRFWDDPTLDLYSMYTREGFQAVLDDKFKIGDAVLMQVLAPMNSHAAVVVEDNQILHHLPGKLSSVDALRPKWVGRVTVHLRHPATSQKTVSNKIHLHEVIDADVLRNPEVKEAIEKQMGS